MKRLNNKEKKIKNKGLSNYRPKHKNNKIITIMMIKIKNIMKMMMMIYSLMIKKKIKIKEYKNY